MDLIPKALSFVVQGVNTNWWGIACPSHCFGVGLPGLAASLAVGLLAGFLLGLAFCAWFCGLLPLPARSVPTEVSSRPGFHKAQGILG